MRFIVWKLPSFSRQGVCSCTKSGTKTITILLICLTLCLVSSANASCKALVAASGQGQHSEQLVRQYINCMRMVETSYFKRSTRGSYGEVPTNKAEDYSSILSNTDQPYLLDEDSTLEPVQDDLWLTGDRPKQDNTNVLGLILLRQSKDTLNSLLRRRSTPREPFIFRILTDADGFLEQNEGQ